MSKKPLFYNGLNYEHKLAASYLAKGFRAKETAKKIIVNGKAVSKQTIGYWLTFNEFKEEVDRNTRVFADTNKKEAIKQEKKKAKKDWDVKEENKKVYERSLDAPVPASVGVKALDNIAKMEGRYMSDKAKDKAKTKEELKKEIDEVNAFIGKYAKRPTSGQSSGTEG